MIGGAGSACYREKPNYAGAEKKSDRLRISPSLGNLLYAVRRDVPLDRPCSILFPLARLALRPSYRRRFRSRSDRSSITCGRLGAAIPLPKGVSPPVTEVGLSGPAKLLISRENELGLRGSPRGGPSEGRAGHQRDQCESSDKCLHHISPYLWITVRDVPATEKTGALCLVFLGEIGSAPRLDQLYLWIY